MKNDKHALFPWLVDEIYQVKAYIKYEIKLAEASLHQLMGRELHCGSKTEQAVDYCTELRTQYKNLLNHMSLDQFSFNSDTSQLTRVHDLPLCYEKIQEIKQQLLLTSTLADEINAIEALIFYYKNLESLLTAQLPQIITKREQERGRALVSLVEAATLQEWLAALVKFAHDIGENTALHRIQIAQLEDNALLSIYKLFIKADYVALINALFFYKIHPHQLYSQSIHPEKQISVRIRLELLYSFIELIQETVLQTLRHRGFTAECDYLFHGDELPEGISVEIAQGCQELITTTIKTWRLTHMRYPDVTLTRGKLDDLFRAYKFWFNPNRLIDTVMFLRIHLVGTVEDEEGYKIFSAQMVLLYQQLTTVQCIDLYGYFSNKDSCYLMRTLTAVFNGYENPKLPLLMNNEKNTVRDVYLNLECVMNSLRDELKNRQISTAPYSRDNYNKLVNPGRRNLKALERIIELYCENKRGRNQLLDRLFAEIEN
ncbi:MAG: hypothetical protein Q8M03_10735 [Legionella sp.]|nr:hypothetical protein [Legionella sp.]